MPTEIPNLQLISSQDPHGPTPNKRQNNEWGALRLKKRESWGEKAKKANGEIGSHSQFSNINFHRGITTKDAGFGGGVQEGIRF